MRTERCLCSGHDRSYLCDDDHVVTRIRSLLARDSSASSVHVTNGDFIGAFNLWLQSLQSETVRILNFKSAK